MLKSVNAYFFYCLSRDYYGNKNCITFSKMLTAIICVVSLDRGTVIGANLYRTKESLNPCVMIRMNLDVE